MLALAFWGAWLRYRGRLYHSRWFHRALIVGAPLGWVATVAGWVVTEAGRQPYVVYGMLRTADAASLIAAAANLSTLLLFIAIYGALFCGLLWYWLRIVLGGPSTATPVPLAGTRTATAPALLQGEAK